jgi:DNA-nicking Smr family endonuclease
VTAPAPVLRRPTRNALERPPEGIEPKRHRRLVRERDDLDARIDLHGMDQDRARLALHGFVRRAYENGWRSLLVITGKGTYGDGILRRRTPEWLAEPDVRGMVAGVSPAHRRHGGDGALYVALKRRR